MAMTDHRAKLQELLFELFQFDSADLDFGFYAVMNHKRDDVARFIEHDLLDSVQDGLKILAAEGQEEAKVALEKAKQAAITGLGEDALDGDNLNPDYKRLPLGKAYLQAKNALENATVSADIEAQIFNDLFQFFARYYQDGDFISQRRYGRSDKYAIPYNGEEVHLHWANFDQYYVKSGTHFSNYSFTVPGSIGLEDGASVQVRITKVDVERDNVKGDKRFFVFADDQEVTWDEAEQTLTIPFEYRPLTPEESKRVGTRNQQDKLLAEAHDAIVKAVPNSTLRAQLTSPDAERKSDKDRLAYHLNRYAAENTRDFFVHKDLSGFLRRELDYFLKNEVIRLDDVDLENVIDMRRAGARAKTIRLIGGKIITFLDQLETFQRHLFLKRKFVLQSDYCLTLDKIPVNMRTDFYPEILANPRQLEEWQQLYGVQITLKTDLDGFPHLMLDTAFFDHTFKLRLLSQFNDVDSVTDGLLLAGENFQALSLLSNKYSKKIDCIYIDPPYNAKSSEILYKNEFKHSSWLSLMDNRIQQARNLIHEKSVQVIAIDENEQEKLGLMLSAIFPDKKISCISVIHNPSGQQGDNFSYTHESAYFIYPAGSGRYIAEEERLEQTDTRNFRDVTGDSSLREAGANCFYPILINTSGHIVGFGEVCDGSYHPESPNVNREDGIIEVYPIDPQNIERKWRFARHTVEQVLDELKPRYIEPRKIWDIYRTKNLFNFKTVWSSSKYSANNYGTQLLNQIIRVEGTLYPKSLFTVLDSIKASLNGKRDGIILDFFAGSGTTGHAVMRLNENGGTHKYILVEMGEHFDTVLKPRIQKVAFSSEWKNCKPVPPKGKKEIVGQSHMFQYIRLESYDDTFHNIRFKDEEGSQPSIISEMPDYMLSYFLEHETAGSPTLLDISQFERPFEYQLLVTGSGGVLSPQPVDLVATFNFLLGLTVHTIRYFERDNQSYVRVIGTNPEGRKVCVIWRNVQATDQMDAERDWLRKEVLTEVEYDKLYMNGDSTLQGVLSTEEEFKRRMFEGVR